MIGIKKFIFLFCFLFLLSSCATMGLENKAEIAAIISNPAARTSKDQPLSLAAGLFNLLSEFASTQASDERQTPAALLRALGSGSQLWADAKDATKKKDTRRQVAAILSAPDIKSSDKVKMITELGDFKTASTFERSRVFHKANKRSKEKIAQINAIHADNKAFAEKKLANDIKEAKNNIKESKV